MMSVLPITICFTHFKSLSMANLEASLYSVRQQDMEKVESIVIVDNDSPDPLDELFALVKSLDFKVPVNLLSYKHGDSGKTHSWSANTAVRKAYSPWVFFTRADYILDATMVHRFSQVIEAHPTGWPGFVVSYGRHLNVDVAVAESCGWRAHGAYRLNGMPGAIIDYTTIDSGVWMTRRDTFESVGGFDESLTAWGHAQTLFQHEVYKTGAEFECVPEVLFYHPLHSGERNIDVSHEQLRQRGYDVRDLWARHTGPKPY